MSTTDWIGSLGVALLLVAYLLNMKGSIKKNGQLYLLLNFIGAALACLASVLLHYLPFIILEGVWAAVSLAELVKRR